jgi:hypothetical protein
VCEWCRDQYGSRNIQNALYNNNELLNRKIFEAITPQIPQLAYHKFGNYVIQVFLDVGTLKQRDTIFEAIRKELIFMSLHNYGCRVVQKVVEHLRIYPENQARVIREMQPHWLQATFNQNGNHIIQRIIDNFEP